MYHKKYSYFKMVQISSFFKVAKYILEIFLPCFLYQKNLIPSHEARDYGIKPDLLPLLFYSVSSSTK
jgi:hypothetical protein